jgi:hypothetical protein
VALPNFFRVKSFVSVAFVRDLSPTARDLLPDVQVQSSELTNIKYPLTCSVAKALFRFKEFLDFDTITILFLFYKHCQIME